MADAFSNVCRRAADICWPEACIIVLLPGETVIIPPLKNFLPPNQAHNVFTAVPMLQVTASLGHPKSLISGHTSEQLSVKLFGSGHAKKFWWLSPAAAFCGI